MAVQVDRLRARIRPVPGVPESARRLTEVLRAAIGRPLERTVSESGFDGPDLVCLRSLEVPSLMPLDEADAELARGWSEAFRGALEAALRSGEAVRYPSLQGAVGDLVLGLLEGDRERAWAWQALGLLDGGALAPGREVGPAIAAALARLPSAIPAQVAATTRRPGAFRRLLHVLSPEVWASLAVRAAVAVGADAPTVYRWLDDGAAPAEDPSGAGGRNAAGVESPSRTLRAAAREAPLDPRRARAVAMLGLLEVEPLGLAGPARRGSDVFLEEARGTLEASSRGPRSGSSPPATAVGREEGGVADPPAPDAPDPAGISDARDGSETAQAERAVEPASTSHGGLLYLLHLVEGLGVLTPREGSTVRNRLHALGLRLTGADPRDPAVLAFCGLGPEAEPPVAFQSGETGESGDDIGVGEIVEGWAEELLVRLESRFRSHGVTEPPSWDEVRTRGAEVVADPGWLQIRLSLDDLSLAVRRAGLDLDPGWLHWLGTVVEFRYV